MQTSASNPKQISPSDFRKTFPEWSEPAILDSIELFSVIQIHTDSCSPEFNNFYI